MALSSKEITRSARIWKVSRPLPVISTTSPERASASATWIAVRRSGSTSHLARASKACQQLVHDLVGVFRAGVADRHDHAVRADLGGLGEPPALQAVAESKQRSRHNARVLHSIARTAAKASASALEFEPRRYGRRTVLALDDAFKMAGHCANSFQAAHDGAAIDLKRPGQGRRRERTARCARANQR